MLHLKASVTCGTVTLALNVPINMSCLAFVNGY